MILFFNELDINKHLSLINNLKDGDIAIFTYDSFYKVFKNPYGLISKGKIKKGCFNNLLEKVYKEDSTKEQTKFEFINKN